MSSWSVQDAEARFGNMLDDCLKNGPQIITRDGTETAVLVPINEWRRLTKEGAKATLQELLLADEPRFELELPDRRDFSMRPPPDFD